MKNLFFVLLMISTPVTWSASAKKNDQLHVVVEVPAGVWNWVQIATLEFEKNTSLDMNNFSMLVVDDGETMTVVFSNVPRKSGQRGTPRGGLGFSVKINKSDKRIVRANFTR
ncbi:MAG: hypothetical protein V4633_11490 [Pseudomonadota bacterium]